MQDIFFPQLFCSVAIFDQLDSLAGSMAVVTFLWCLRVQVQTSIDAEITVKLLFIVFQFLIKGQGAWWLGACTEASQREGSVFKSQLWAFL